MGGFSSAARVAAPVALAVAAPYVGQVAGLTGMTEAAAAESAFGQMSALSWKEVMGLGAASLMGEMGYQQQLKAQQAANARAVQEASFMQQEAARREKQRRDLLAREQASARARLGAMGLGSVGGSGAAVLSGLARPTLEAIDGDRAALDHRIGGLFDTQGSSGAGLARNLVTTGINLLDRVKVDKDHWLNKPML